ncbi:hypothetical protein [Neokomagataea anthophila]|uniref:Uncharacterized protein n=1 Tax=Neokomagataea anthophila TaxID=2826925 RepID=A0ABS5E836_9PROT|nr:hypothetical protein [Neokomagataea anthophila]MBR0559966.1 hypothetical protein [Neokomagataea anthophila]
MTKNSRFIVKAGIIGLSLSMLAACSSIGDVSRSSVPDSVSYSPLVGNGNFP